MMTSLTPAWARWKAVAAPANPPPTITTRARSGTGSMPLTTPAAGVEQAGLLRPLLQPRGAVQRSVGTVLARDERPLQAAAEIHLEGRRAAAALVADVD